MGRAGPGEARGGEGLVLDKRPGTGLELDVGEGKPLAPLRLSRLGASGSNMDNIPSDSCVKTGMIVLNLFS